MVARASADEDMPATVARMSQGVICSNAVVGPISESLSSWRRRPRRFDFWAGY